MVTNFYFQCHYFRFQKLCQLYWQLLNITSIRRVRYLQFFTIRISHIYLDLQCHYLCFLKLCQLLNITRQLDILKKILSGYYPDTIRIYKYLDILSLFSLTMPLSLLFDALSAILAASEQNSIRRVRNLQLFTIRISHICFDLPCHYLCFVSHTSSFKI